LLIRIHQETSLIAVFIKYQTLPLESSQYVFIISRKIFSIVIKLIDKSLWREWWSALIRQGMTVDKWNASILRGSVVLQNNQDLHKNIMRLLASAFAMRRQHLTGSTMLLIILFFFSIIPTATAHADGVPPSLNILKSASELD